MDKEDLREIFSKNLKTFLLLRGKSQQDLSKALKVSSGLVSDWCNGVKTPRMSNLQRIADFLHIMPSDLVYEKASLNQTKEMLNIPIIGEVCAGNGILAEENIIEYTGIDESIAKRGLFFGLKIKGDSMTPEIPDKSTVIVRQQPDVESGEIAIVFIEDTSEGVCKAVYKKNNDIILQSVNTSYPPLVFPNGEGVQIIGKVFECRIKINKKDAKK